MTDTLILVGIAALLVLCLPLYGICAGAVVAWRCLAWLARAVGEVLA